LSFEDVGSAIAAESLSGAKMGAYPTVAFCVEPRYRRHVTKPHTLCVALVFVSPLLMGGCGYTVSPTSPRPHILITVDKAPSDVVLGSAIEDDFDLPKSNTFFWNVRVRGWRKTLDAAFGNAFVRGAGSGRKLTLVEAELWFSHVKTPTSGIVANIRYKAFVVDPSGREMGGFAGQAMSKEPVVFDNEFSFTDAAATAVEVMYEQLTASLLTQI
jgi:hypothetical protein